MINQPPIDDLEKIVDCRYMLVTVVAKRARQLMAAQDSLDGKKPVTYAVDELYDGKLHVIPKQIPEVNITNE